MKLKNYKQRIESIPEFTKREAKHSLDILDRIHELLQEKFGGRQKLLAEKMGKKEAEISRWINGNHNFTMKTISKLEAAFGAPIIAVCTSDVDADFEQVKSPFNTFHKTVFVSEAGLREERQLSFTEVKMTLADEEIDEMSI
ncbi:helix-turn-helix domain-containing protein [Niabella drilacis]|uniref:Helix-turn-helix n=1 Tax=Niabella drilacis (strain DSM 25811 / CCM 8410 / CCUG 62505 / LMG 26954 / E90) TaxID=1285928 RepID=A0A1G6LIG9_NIADE|nr:helix-turn-helix transcriptional regulator [Niabella drilacis]SDC42396.1 Helix-turn-helix [Niabella drilacis]